MPKVMAVPDSLPAVPTPTGVGALLQRLADGTLRADEAQTLQRAEAVLRMEREGRTYTAMAATLGMPFTHFTAMRRTNRYRVLRKYCMERDADTSEQEQRKIERRQWDAFGERVLLYYDLALKMEKGKFVNEDRAERAAKLYAQSAGWLDPLPRHEKPRELKPGIIQAQMAGIAAADRKETVVRVTVGEATVEVGVRESRQEEQAIG